MAQYNRGQWRRAPDCNNVGIYYHIHLQSHFSHTQHNKSMTEGLQASPCAVVKSSQYNDLKHSIAHTALHWVCVQMFQAAFLNDCCTFTVY